MWTVEVKTPEYQKQGRNNKNNSNYNKYLFIFWYVYIYIYMKHKLLLQKIKMVIYNGYSSPSSQLFVAKLVYY